MYCHPSSVEWPCGHSAGLSRARCPDCVGQDDSIMSVHRRSIVLSDAENLVSVGSRPRSLDPLAFCPSTRSMLLPCYGLSPAQAAGRGPCRADVAKECYLVDPASSHMLVSKIKPCMCNYSLFDGICYSDNRSNSRTNTCNKPRLLEGMHLLDKRSTRALPVALMIHDNSTDLKKLVVGPRGGSAGPPHGEHRSARPYCRRCAPGLNWPGRSSGAVTLKKLECSKQAYASFAKDVFINQERKLGARRRSDTVLVSTINDADQGSADVAFRTPPAPYEKSKSLGSGGSMVARLKLKGIDGRAPPGVEPAA
ncbi:hypothetical protein HRI_005286000 [Hibiscus trionum]|uniref:Uncharacterized protein n=1 Tax=Hibiscus trionum TaxID=183268 RepID=A0A9W7JM85_HIBTR|nr:hypothetical protein HRI_005286000 [Hibiscus trionum]